MSNFKRFSLVWNEFKDNASSGFTKLRRSKHFSDVTLVSEDGNQIEAHRAVLAASSPLFSNILMMSKDDHPTVFLDGIKRKHLVSMLDFLYNGKTKVSQGSLEEFLAITKELGVKGLSGNFEDSKFQSDLYKDFAAETTNQIIESTTEFQTDLSQEATTEAETNTVKPEQDKIAEREEKTITDMNVENDIEKKSSNNTAKNLKYCQFKFRHHQVGSHVLIVKNIMQTKLV